MDYPLTQTPVNFHREIESLLLDQYSIFDTGLETTMSNRRTSEWDAGNMHDRCGPQAPSHVEDLTGIPLSTLPDTQLPEFNSSMGFAPVHPESVSSYLTPKGYSSRHQDPSASETAGSTYAWPIPLTAGLLRPSSLPKEPAAGVSDPGPFMQSYYLNGPSQSQSQNFPGYDHEQTNKWCMERIPEGRPRSMNSHTAPLPEISPLSFSAAEMPSSTCPTFEENLDAISRQLFSPLQSSDPFFSHMAGNTPDVFLSPSSAPAGSCSGFSMPSHSPAPSALSDNDLSPSSHQPSSPQSNAADLSQYGIPTADGAWRCAYPGCKSHMHFHRGCDLRKHFNRHRKHLFCRHYGCSQSRRGGFSSKKDRARHESKHNPGVVCVWEGCGRVFSRVDNMKDHVRRIHRRGD